MKITGTRQAIHDALTWAWQKKGGMSIIEWIRYQTKIDRSFQAGDWHNVDLVEAGIILAAVNSQRPEVASWLHYGYGAWDRDMDRRNVAASIYLDLFMGAKKAERHKAMCRVAVDDYRLRRRGRIMPIEVYGHEMEMDVSHWKRDWHDKQMLCLDSIESMDLEGVGNVSKVVKQLRGEGEYRNLAQALEDCRNSP